MDLLEQGIKEAFGLLTSGDRLVVSAAARSLQVSLVAVIAGGVLGVVIGSFLARVAFPGRGFFLMLFRVGMSFPTVLVGLVGYALLSRRGPLGEFGLLYTPAAIMIGEFFLALPIVVTWTHGGIAALDDRVADTARTLGAGRCRRWLTYLSEAKLAVMLALLTAFARCFTELGVAMMIGGNISYRTRTLATATALETARGEFARGIAMSLILFVIAVAVTVATFWIGKGTRARAEA